MMNSSAGQVTPASTTPLRRLISILSSAVETIEQQYDAKGLAFPSLNEPWNPADPAEIFKATSEVVTGATATIIAAADQLIASVKTPAVAAIEASVLTHIPSCIGVAEELNIAQILTSAGSSGLHVEIIAQRAGTNKDQLARVLRLLASNHFFREVAPDVFANNRLSSALYLGVDAAIARERPVDKYDASSGIAALVAHGVQEVSKASPFLVDHFKDADRVNSDLPNMTPFNMAFKTDLPYFDWLDQPDNSSIKHRFGVAMDGTTKMEPGDAILRGFDWTSVPVGGTLVDVGGGIGATSMIVAKNYSSLKVVVQDRPAVVPHTQKFWNAEYPEAVRTNQVTVQAHDFFEPQPVKEASVHLLRGIIHDWSDSYCHKILSLLRDAAGPQSQLLIIDHFNTYTCELPPNAWRAPGDDRPTAPAPLLANFGRAGMNALFDLQMLVLLNGKERTLQDLHTLLKAAGWKIQRMFCIQGSPIGQVLASPLSESDG